MNLQTMPHIPSSTELGMASWGSELAAKGRNEDSALAHVAPGETMIPPVVLAANPELQDAIAKAFQRMGADPTAFIVGHPNMSINPETGLPEYGFLSGVGRAFKKFTGSTLGKIALTVAGSMIGAPYIGAAAGAGLGAAAGTKLGGGSWGEAIGSGAGTYFGAGAGFGGNMLSGTIGNTVGNVAGSSIAGALPSVIGDATWSSALGSFVGGKVGEPLGGTLFGSSAKEPKQKSSSAWIGEYNDTAQIPVAGASGLALPTTQTPTQGATNEEINKGAGINPNAPGLTYMAPVKDRFTGETSYTETASPFSDLFGRKQSWGEGVVFV